MEVTALWKQLISAGWLYTVLRIGFIFSVVPGRAYLPEDTPPVNPPY